MTTSTVRIKVNAIPLYFVPETETKTTKQSKRKKLYRQKETFPLLMG